MKERKQSQKPSQKQSKYINSAFLDYKLRQRLTKAAAGVKTITESMIKDREKSKDDELHDELNRQVEELDSIIKDVRDRREAAEALRDELKESMGKEFFFSLCGSEFCDDDNDNDNDDSENEDEDETKFYGDTKYIKLTPKEFKQILEFFGNAVRVFSVTTWMGLLKTRMEKLVKWEEPFVQKSMDFMKTDLYKAHENFLDSLVAKVGNEEFYN
jgi:hypothetical protein